MKTYKDFEKISIGSSDIASLILAGFQEDKGTVAQTLNFGEDGLYEAYYVTEPCIIGDHYKKVASFTSWLRIYDDTDIVFNKHGDFNIYRAGEFGCIIEKVK